MIQTIVKFINWNMGFSNNMSGCKVFPFVAHTKKEKID